MGKVNGKTTLIREQSYIEKITIICNHSGPGLMKCAGKRERGASKRGLSEIRGA